MPRKKYMGKEPKKAPNPPMSKEEKEELRKKFDPIDEIKVPRGKQPTPLAGGGIAAGIRRFNRGGKV